MFNIVAPSKTYKNELKKKIDGKTKPIGSLGRLENLALQIGVIQNSLEPKLTRPVVIVFAGDHGVVESGVSPYPQAVTQQMVMNFIGGGAAINVFAEQNGFVLRIVDSGINFTFEDCKDLIDAKIAYGTQNFVYGSAMTEAQCKLALEEGSRIVRKEILNGSNIVAFGEMGIGNTTSAAAIMAAICNFEASKCAGRGTGLDDEGLKHKIRIIDQALTKHQSTCKSPLDVLAALGGFEIAMMVGAILESAQAGVLIVIDGFICTSALLVATKISPEVLEYCVFAHCSNESGHQLLLNYLNAEPLLDLGFRLGEGTGAVLAYPLIDSAVRFLNEMASFDSAGVSSIGEK